jgi:hypothetical protein
LESIQSWQHLKAGVGGEKLDRLEMEAARAYNAAAKKFGKDVFNALD